MRLAITGISLWPSIKRCFSAVFLLLTALCPLHAQSACEDFLDGADNDKQGLYFPSELKLHEDRINALLETGEFKDLVLELGTLFSKLDQNPYLLEQLPFAINTDPNRMSAPPKSLASPSLSKKLKALSTDHMERYRLRLAQLESHFENDDVLSPTDLTWLAFFVLPLSVQPHFESELREFSEFDTSFEAKLTYIQKTLALYPEHRRFFEAAIKPNGLSNELGRKELEILESILSEGGILPKEEYFHDLMTILSALNRVTQVITDRSTPSLIKLKMNFISLVSYVDLFFIIPIREARSKDLGDIKFKTPVMNFVEDVYFKSALSKYDRQAYMDVIELIIFGTPFPHSKNKVTAALLESAKSSLLEAKSFLSQQKARNTMTARKYDFKVTPFVLNLPLPVQETTKNSKKRKHQNGRTANTKSLPPEVLSQKENSRFMDFSKYTSSKRKTLAAIEPERTYELEFLRDQSQAVQKITFSKDLLDKMQSAPREAYLIIDGLVLGFTSRAHRGGGIKRLTRYGNNVYEVRPNRGHYRMIMTRKNNHWVPVDFIRKADFEIEMERIRKSL